MTTQELLADYPVTVERDVAWGEMDAFQHVNNVQYFRYFEDARIAYFREMGIYRPGEDFGRHAPILASTSCRFKAPLTYPDALQIGTRVIEIEDDRLTFEYAVASDKLDRIATVGEGVIVSFDYEAGRKVDLPEEWVEAIERLEG